MQGPGNDMTGTLPREMSSSVFSHHLRGSVGQPHAEPSPRAGQSPSPDPAALLITLLSAAPVDLCRVSEEMRAHPDLQALVVKLACYLSFSPDTSGTTVEESVVVVGTDRLRVLVYLWSMLRQRRVANNPGDPRESTRSGASETSGRFSQARSSLQSEIADLAKFLESLGLDSAAAPRHQPPFTPSGPPEAEFFELTDMLVRDVVSLIPLIEPAFRQQQNSPVAGRMARAGKEAE